MLRNFLLAPLLTFSLVSMGVQDKPVAPPKTTTTGTLSPEMQKLLHPALTDVEKLQLQVISQKLEIAQLKAQAAQRDFDAAREEFSKLLASLQKEGFTLDLQKLEYVLTPVKKEPK